MRVLAVADVHAEEYVADRLRVLVSKNDYDAAFVVGDLTTRGPVVFAERFLEFLPNPFVVHGNMDSPQVLELIEKSGASVHLRSRKLGDYTVVGCGGSNPTPFNTPVEYAEDQLRAGLSKLTVDSKTIALIHAPPNGLFDEVAEGIHVGSRAVLEFIEKTPPLLSIHAHIHDHEGEAQLGRTKIVKLGAANKGKAAEITLEGEKIQVNFLQL